MRPHDLEALLAELESMPGCLEDAAGALPGERARLPGPDGGFCLVEQAWHLADLEREGYALWIRSLQEETEPRLPDFDGAGLARERDYRSRSLFDGMARFAAARAANVAALRLVPDDAWERGGTQEGVGPVALADLPRMMVEHDKGHREEIDRLTKAHRG